MLPQFTALSTAEIAETKENAIQFQQRINKQKQISECLDQINISLTADDEEMTKYWIEASAAMGANFLQIEYALGTKPGENPHHLLMQLVHQSLDETSHHTKVIYYKHLIHRDQISPTQQYQHIKSAVLAGVTFDDLKYSLNKDLINHWAYAQWEDTNTNIRLFRQHYYLNQLGHYGKLLLEEISPNFFSKTTKRAAHEKQIEILLESFLQAGGKIDTALALLPMGTGLKFAQFFEEKKGQPRFTS